MCFDFLYNSYQEKFLILRRTERDVIKNEQMSSCPVIVILDVFLTVHHELTVYYLPAFVH